MTNDTNLLGIYHVGVEVNAAGISALGTETVPMMKCHLLPR